MLYFLTACLDIIIFFAGASVFSFLNVVVWRLPRGLSFVKGRSMCPDCGHELGFSDMVPVLSWLFLRGKCRYCHTKIAFRYTLMELIGGAAALFCASYFEYSWRSLEVFVLFGFLTMIAFIDKDTMEIPDGMVVGVALCGVADVILRPEISIFARIIGVFCISVPLFLINLPIPDAFGGGDIKLMAAAGLLLGWKSTLVAFMVALILGGSYGAWLLLSKRKGRREHFAFGPAICAGVALAACVGEQLFGWYTRFYI